MSSESEERGGSPLILDEPSEQGKRWGRFVKRLLMVLLRPKAFWERTADDKISFGEIMWPHATILIAVRALAGFLGSLLGGAEFTTAIAAFVSSFVSWMALVWVFALIVGSIATARGGKMGARDPLRYSVYGLTPLFVVGVLAAIPFPYVAPIAELVAMPYTFHVMGLGVVPLLGVPLKRAPALVGLLCGLLLILWGVMPTLVPLALDAALSR